VHAYLASFSYKSLYKSYFSHYFGDYCRGARTQELPVNSHQNLSFLRHPQTDIFYQNISSRAVERVFKTVNVFSRPHFFIASFCTVKNDVLIDVPATNQLFQDSTLPWATCCFCG